MVKRFCKIRCYLNIKVSVEYLADRLEVVLSFVNIICKA